MPAPAASPPLSAPAHRSAMRTYIAEGEGLALKLGNRGPLRLTDNGDLHPEIVTSYRQHGCYVFENVITRIELEQLRQGIDHMLERAPVKRHAKVDAEGKPSLDQKFTRDTYTWITPLSDPVGGTHRNGGRHPAKMSEPVPSADAPAEIIYMMFGMCQTMDAGLRVYGHPKLLAAAATLNGADFTPYNDAIFIKQPGLGGSVAWHQDGLTHWDSNAWDEDIHGFNYQVQLYPSTPANCLWVLPGTHKLGKVDIAAMVANNKGSDRLPGAVPLFCNAGDVTLVNRQLVHCSFANTSPDLRVSLTFGFHKRSSVLGAKGVLGSATTDPYDEDRIFERSRVIAAAIDARAQEFPNESRFTYQPFAGLEADYRWNEQTRAAVIHDYNLKDLGI